MAAPDNIDPPGTGPGGGEAGRAPDGPVTEPAGTDPVAEPAGTEPTVTEPVAVRQRSVADVDAAERAGEPVARSAEGVPLDPGVEDELADRSDRSPWNWLLLVPILVPLLTFLFNATDPTLGGFPRFYWLQLAFIALGVAVTTIVYQATKGRR
jgi:hypothetical protein